MIEARAVVLRIEGDQAWVRVTEQAGGCGRCDEPGGCRSVRITQLFKPARETFRLSNGIGAQPGDAVRICMNDGAPLRAALASYGLGAVLVVAGASLAALGGGDGAVLAGALGGLLLAVPANRLLMRSRRWRSGLHMAVLGAQPGCARVQEEGH
ncbi:SoxR reducing system RseC family protein [Pseudothauera rhizosphaerae]|uniref:Fis family transcriptional regulator n=1 Tax=Pseudothauera rhizosphaerae TaxID=2565932 RepID=A0A4V3WAW5_9RHOO|nr:SoxR reducing system RseC family protein [Pseudothauera rhizosphaerae]THF60887.1 Fis family transcriptional regulator [Pseudothauera rhizosphaerae]